MYDYHLHSNFSGDCLEEMEDVIKQAILLNGKELCFTDHLDYDYPTDEVDFQFDQKSFEATFYRLKEKYKNQIILKKGIELGLQRHLSKTCNDFLESYKPDFVIASFHVAERLDLYNGDFYKNKTPEQAWNLYFDEVYQSLRNFKNYSVVGHLDIPKRYDEKVRGQSLELYKEKLIKVLDLIIKDNRGIEVNTSGLRTELKETLPSRAILELYYDRGGKYITIGSDAHTKEDVYKNYDKTLRELYEIGFEEITTYDQMQAFQIKIKDLL
jgi:histidinol-phosphatase (PHP family)